MKRINFPTVIYFLVIFAFLSVAIAVYAQQKTDKNSNSETSSCPMMEKMADKNTSHEDCPMMKKTELKTSEKQEDNQNHSDHYKMVMENGEKEMGFSQTATTHHFLIMKDGGAIQVEANDSKNTNDRDKIRVHLAEIAKQFQNGIFTTPFAIHGQVPPGVPEMDNLKNEIRYGYEETEKGARVRISTDNPKALAAIHAFLKFQIEDHQTGDPVSPED
jgi:hypothetical protein